MPYTQNCHGINVVTRVSLEEQESCQDYLKSFGTNFNDGQSTMYALVLWVLKLGLL